MSHALLIDQSSCPVESSVLSGLLSMLASLTLSMPARPHAPLTTIMAPPPRAPTLSGSRRLKGNATARLLFPLLVLLSLEECSGSCVDSGLAGSSQRAASRIPATCCVWLCLHCVSSVFSLHMLLVKLSRNFDPSACARFFLHRFSSPVSSSSMTAASPNLSLQNNSASLKFNSSSCVNRHLKDSSPPFHAPPTLMRLPIDCSSPLIWACMLSSRSRLSCQGGASWFPCLLSRWHLSLLSRQGLPQLAQGIDPVAHLLFLFGLKGGNLAVHHTWHLNGHLCLLERWCLLLRQELANLRSSRTDPVKSRPA